MKNFFLQEFLFLLKKLSGVGIAEEPPNSTVESFGIQRFNLIAVCLFRASKKKLNSFQLLRFVLCKLKKNDLDINRLYLNSFSSEDIF